MSWMPAVVSASRVRMGRRRFVTNCWPTRGKSRFTYTRVCSAEWYSERSSAQKAKTSATWPPSGSTTRMRSPADMRSAWPSRAGMRMVSGMRPVYDAGMEQRVSLATLGVSDLARARAFYEGLGWRTGAAPADDVVFFQAGGMVLALWGREQLAEDSVVADGGGWGGVTLAYNTRSPAEVDAVLEEARAAGGTVLREGAETFWGGYSGVFADPDGHPWEVAHNPHWTLREDGSVQLG